VTTADKRSAIAATLLRWLLFGVVVATAPLLADALSGLTRGEWVSMEALLTRGELLLVAAAISAAAIGELFAKDMASMLVGRLLIGGASLVLILMSALWFADIAAALRDGETVDASWITLGSLIIFGMAAIVGACAMVLAEMSRWR
jgi:hypothetical protein